MRKFQLLLLLLFVPLLMQASELGIRIADDNKPLPDRLYYSVPFLYLMIENQTNQFAEDIHVQVLIDGEFFKDIYVDGIYGNAIELAAPGSIPQLTPGTHELSFLLMNYTIDESGETLADDEDLSNNQQILEIQIQGDCGNSEPELGNDDLFHDLCSSEEFLYEVYFYSEVDEPSFDVTVVEVHKDLIISLRDTAGFYDLSAANHGIFGVSHPVGTGTEIGLTVGAKFSDIHGPCVKISDVTHLPEPSVSVWEFDHRCVDDGGHEIEILRRGGKEYIPVAGSLAELLGIDSIKKTVQLTIPPVSGTFKLYDELGCLDTIQLVLEDCSNEISGTYTVGSTNADFADFTELRDFLSTGVITDDLTIVLQEQEYFGGLTFNNAWEVSSPYLRIRLLGSGAGGEEEVEPLSLVNLGSESIFSDFNIDIENISFEGSGYKMVELENTQWQNKVVNCRFLQTNPENFILYVDDCSIRCETSDFTGGFRQVSGRDIHQVITFNCEFMNYFDAAIWSVFSGNNKINSCNFYSENAPQNAVYSGSTTGNLYMGKSTVKGNNQTAVRVSSGPDDGNIYIETCMLTSELECVRNVNSLTRIRNSNLLTSKHRFTVWVNRGLILYENSIIANSFAGPYPAFLNTNWENAVSDDDDHYQFRYSYTNFYSETVGAGQNFWDCEPYFLSSDDLHIGNELLFNTGNSQFAGTRDIDGEFRDGSPSIGADQNSSISACDGYIVFSYDSPPECPCYEDEFDFIDITSHPGENYDLLFFSLDNQGNILNTSTTGMFNNLSNASKIAGLSYEVSEGLLWDGNFSTLTDGNGVSMEDGACIYIDYEWPHSFPAYYDELNVHFGGFSCSSTPGMMNFHVFSNTNTGDCATGSASLGIVGEDYNWSLSPHWGTSEYKEEIFEIPDSLALAGFSVSWTRDYGGCLEGETIAPSQTICTSSPDCQAGSEFLEGPTVFCYSDEIMSIEVNQPEFVEEGYSTIYALVKNDTVININQDTTISLLNDSGEQLDLGLYDLFMISYLESDGLILAIGDAISTTTNELLVGPFDGACMNVTRTQTIRLRRLPKVALVNSYCDAEGNYLFEVAAIDGGLFDFRVLGSLATHSISEIDESQSSHTFVIPPDTDGPWNLVVRTNNYGLTCENEYEFDLPECTPGIDASILELFEPSTEATTGLNEFTVSVLNNGPENMTSLTINWSIDGQEQIPYGLEDIDLAPGENYEVSIGAYQFESAGNYQLAIWTENPNNGADENPGNDYFYATINVGEEIVCTNLQFMEDVLCDDSDDFYLLLLTAFENYADEYVVENLLTGESEVVSGNSINLGPFDSGSGYAFQVSIAGEEACGFVAQQGMVDCLSTAIELISFEGSKRGENNLLEWVVAHENETAAYILEYSMNGSDFAFLGEVEAAVNSNTQLQYEFEHVNPSTVVNYYRLIEKTTSGELLIVSEVVAIDNSGTGFLSEDEHVIDATIFPNPASDQFSIKLDRSEWLDQNPVSFQVFNVNGQLIHEGESLEETTRVNCNDWSPGIYFISLESEGQVSSQRLYKQ